MADIVLNVEVRERTGTGGARDARRSGLVPGILYGGDKDPVAIAVKKNEFRKALYTGKLLGHLVTRKYGKESQPVIAKDVQFHPVTDEPVPFDLYRVEEHQAGRGRDCREPAEEVAVGQDYPGRALGEEEGEPLGRVAHGEGQVDPAGPPEGEEGDDRLRAPRQEGRDPRLRPDPEGRQVIDEDPFGFALRQDRHKRKWAVYIVETQMSQPPPFVTPACASAWVIFSPCPSSV